MVETHFNSSRIISTILSPALQFWLRSQVEDVQTLQLQIQGQDLQILGGYIPGVSLYSQKAIYQGLHLGQIEVLAENIRINLGQILRGKPFRLLEPIQVSGNIQIEQSNVQASLSSSILFNALNELLLLLLESNEVSEPENILTQGNLSWLNIDLGVGQFKLQGVWTNLSEQKYIFTLIAGLKLFSPQVLYLYSLQIEGLPEPYQVSLAELFIDLGTDVEISTLLVSQGELKAEGKALIRN